MPLPPGADFFPAKTTYPEQMPATLQSTCEVATRDPATTQFTVRGPYQASRVPLPGAVQVKGPTGGAQLVQIDERWCLPISSGVRARSVITDLATNLTYEVVSARTFDTFIECQVRRATGDT